MKVEASGLIRQKLNQDKLFFKAGKPIIGYTDENTEKLDLDETTFKKAKYIAHRVRKWFNLEGFIILKSSKNSYHVVFNKTVTWNKNLEILSWACYISGFNLALMRYFVMQTIKGESTLRIGSKRRKKPPKIVYRYGKQDCEIKTFLQYRKEVKHTIVR
jgi:hypothetical protein